MHLLRFFNGHSIGQVAVNGLFFISVPCSTLEASVHMILWNCKEFFCCSITELLGSFQDCSKNHLDIFPQKISE